MTDDLPLISNNAPTGEALLDDFLSSASIAQIGALMEPIGARMAEDDPTRAETRAQLLSWTALWQDGGEVDGVTHAARPKILDAAMAGKATTLAKKLKNAIQAEEDAREPAKQPLFRAGKTVDAAFTARKKELKPALDWITERIGEWQTSENDRMRVESEAAAAEAKKRDDAARQAALEAAANDPVAIARAAEAAEAAQRAAQTLADAEAERRGKMQVRSATGALATTQTVKKYRVTDWRAVPEVFLQFDEAKVRSSFRAGLPVAGIEEYEETSTLIR